MTPDRWQQIKQVAGAAIDLAEERRGAFLDQECGSDWELRQAVEAILAEDGRAGGTIEAAIAAVADDMQDRAVRRSGGGMPGRSISHYKITEKLGQGGMGVVWKAEDTQLRRTVALKFLSRDTLDEEDVKVRLIREAQAAASLDHPNICAVHGIHEEGGETFLAMAFIDGPSLAEKIKERPLPLEVALDIATQIGDGLREAHEKGIVHRDIKPQNIMLTAKGQVKIMDFGLASLAGRSKLTKSGTMLGTPAYMSPEQLQAKQADHRTDIWALGCVMYEMLTQRTPFAAEYQQAIAYGILNEDPEPISAQRADVTPEVDRLIGKALAKDPAERYQHADDLLADLRVLEKQSRVSNKLARGPDVVSAASIAGTVDPLPEKRSRSQQAAIVLLGFALLALAMLPFTGETQSSNRDVLRFALFPEGLLNAQISPDGKHILYAAEVEGRRRLWLRPLSSEQVRPLPGTENVVRGAFWAPDSLSIGFVADNELKRLSPADGAAPIALCDIPGGFEGGSWSRDGRSIVFSSGSQLYEVPARGGEAVALTESAAFPGQGSPTLLPALAGKRGVVFHSGINPFERTIVVLDLVTGESRQLAPGAHPAYSSAGFLLFGPPAQQERGLRALPFSPESLSPTGQAFPIATDGVAATLSETGTLTYVDWEEGSLRLGAVLTLRDRSGELLQTIGQPDLGYYSPAFSPNGRSVAVAVGGPGDVDVWVYDLIRSTRTRLTFDPEPEAFNSWSASGREVLYRRVNGIRSSILRRSANGVGEAVPVLDAGTNVRVFDWSRDGRYFLYEEAGANRSEIKYMQMGPDGVLSDAVVFSSGSARKSSPALSPDGRFLAYVSSESGRSEVYISSFPSGDGRWLVSAAGGAAPRWARDGSELIYKQGRTLLAVRVSAQSGFELGQPQRLFQIAPGIGHYDVSADGRRFAIVEATEEAETVPPTIHVVQNWYEEFRDRGQN